MSERAKPAPPNFNTGLEYMRRGAYQQAAGIFKNVFSSRPDYTPALYNLGLMLCALENWEDARRVVTLYVKRVPGDPYGHLLEGYLERELKNYDKAEACFLRALRFQGKEALACNQLGKTMLLQGNWSRALQWYQKSLSLKPNSLQAFCGLSEAFERQGDIGKALATYLKALRVIELPRGFVFYLRAGLLLIKLERWEEACRVLGRAVAFHRAASGGQEPNGVIHDRGNAELAQIYGNLGWVLNRIERFDEAAEALQDAVKLQPQDPQMLYQLGWTLLKLTRPREAVPPLNQAVQISPDFTEARFHLGLALLASGDGPGAFQQYKILERNNRYFARKLLNCLDS